MHTIETEASITPRFPDSETLPTRLFIAEREMRYG
jgi:hypothetical protein